MMVIFVSQCEKKALKRTRQVLDAFADRIGDNTWQTAITEEGLQAVKKLLRKTASKNTAVSCHWIRSRARSDLLWVVGNKRQFDYRGVVAVNRTKRNIMYSDEQNNWFYISSIQIMATLAALLHDIGKSTIGFQLKLQGLNKFADTYRHEWVSLKLFAWLVDGCDSDAKWLQRLSRIDEYLQQAKPFKLLDAQIDETGIANMPPLAQWLAWLIVTHHRLPPFSEVYFKNNQSRENLKKSKLEIKNSLNQYYNNYLKAFAYWVRNPKSIENANSQFKASFWNFEQCVWHSSAWQKQVKRWSAKALNDATLMQMSEYSVSNQVAIGDTFLLYMSRLTLMLADHHYSSLQCDDKRRVQGAKEFLQLAANTDSKTKQTKQALDEHLLGVAQFAAKLAKNLPKIARALPALKEHKQLAQQTANARFKWQNHAYNAVCAKRELSQEHGFFGVNMASTGCGKTIGNARIMYALGDPKQGARFTVALGLRVLTLQTGLSFRENLHLSDQQLAILVGGVANKKLFEISKDAGGLEKIQNESDTALQAQTHGSESLEELIDGWLDSDIDFQDYAELGLGTLLETEKLRQLLFSPIVTCTVDHLIQASECKRGGRYIAPMLRLLSSDLILDEPDDFDESDLPALARLVHLAGLFGSRILLSSATLTPDMVAGLFNAYQKGRELFNKSQNKSYPNIVCAWIDEQNSAKLTQCENLNHFVAEHHAFICKRVSYLNSLPIRRIADILPLQLSYSKEFPKKFYTHLGQTIIDGAIELHAHHHQIEPSENKEVSIGLVRIANIKNIIAIAKQLFEKADIGDDIHIHLCCYHARQLLVLRNHLENKLDRILQRSHADVNHLFTHAEIKQALAKSPAKKHIFIVMATAVAEVGRDHDYDWAIVEPSSMRSVIQLAGRIWRHRPDKIADKTNMLILQYNLNYFIGKINDAVFTHPGFERKRNQLPTYDASELITAKQRAKIDAVPRIAKPDYVGIQTLSDLEHFVMQDLLNHSGLNYVNAYYNSSTANNAHTHLQQISPFRLGKPQDDWILVPNPQSPHGFDAYYAEDVYQNKLVNATPQNHHIRKMDYSFQNKNITPWLLTDLNQALQDIANNQENIALQATKYATVALSTKVDGWQFHAFFGFVES